MLNASDKPPLNGVDMGSRISGYNGNENADKCPVGGWFLDETTTCKRTRKKSINV